MGIAIASGVPVAAGLITGIVGGLVVGWFAGAPLQVSGPAAGLTVIVYELVRQHGLEVLGIAVLICGALQLAAGLLRYGQWFRAVSPAVIYGMLAGIGVLIFSSQFHVMVDDAPKGSGIANLVSIPDAIRKGSSISKLGTVEERRARRELLQQLGALHEQQVQLRESAAERIPKPPADANTQQAADPPEAIPAEDSRLEPLALRQQELSRQFSALVQQLEKQGVSQNVNNPVALQAAIDDALDCMETALSDLQQGRTERVRASQEGIQRGLERVLGSLNNHDWAAKIGLLTIAALVLWRMLAPNRLKLIPAPLVAVVIATAVSAILNLPVLYVEVPDNLWSEVHFPNLTVLSSVPFGVVFQGGVVLAVVASAETLLCATAVDQMQSETRTNYDRELAAQGVGNMVCGLLGALPMTGVIVRSSANVDAGAKTRLSTILHGLWLLVFVALLAHVLRMIPTSALAAMLVYTGYKLINFRVIRSLKKYGWGEVIVYFATLGTIVCVDLLTGVITGIALSAAKLLYTFSHLELRLDLNSPGSTATLSLQGAATFVRLPMLASELERVPHDVELHVDFEHLDYIDHACLDLLMNWAKQHEGTGGTLVIDWESLHSTFSNQLAQKQRIRREKA
jgi:MFS superfamily sulfate permease-like transporter